MRKRLTLLTALAVLGSTAACGGGPADDGRIELTIGTFTEFGYEQLLAEYEAAHPGIKVVHHKTGQGGPYHQALFTKLGAGSGLADVQAVEEGYLADVLARPSLFANLEEIGPKSVTADRWLDWKYQAAKAKDGTLIGYGTDIGPMAMCYRKDLFAAAGLPSEPEAVKPLFATWQSYFAAGEQFVAKSGGKAWFDSAAQIFNAMHNQLDTGYFDRQDKLTVENNAAVKQNWEQVTAASARGQSAKLVAFSNEWNSGFKTGAFATKTCPAWMLGVIKEQAGPDNAGKWAVTDAFPGGGGNWGGSFLTVPKQSKHPKEAAELAAWLTAPEQQVKAFLKAGTFPSQTRALSAPELLSSTNEYFGGVRSGELFATQARKVGKAQYKGPGDGKIQENVTSPALQAVEQGLSPREGWQRLVDGAKKLAK
ncbi:ABC transporter substrate-binding protein [Allokutzneria oryzae]|uniref:ABC transporter substrate-binding protein n=1 Tax=Allokutzneria oryzae TaxID=1378989 RepID=UPI00406BAC42